MELITATKRFMIQAPGVDFINFGDSFYKLDRFTTIKM
jgi:hypothetical protein